MAPAETSVTVMSFNIHHGQGTDSALDLARIARVIRASGAGIAGLQEVDRNFAKRSNWTDQAAELLQGAEGSSVELQAVTANSPPAHAFRYTSEESTGVFSTPSSAKRALSRSR